MGGQDVQVKHLKLPCCRTGISAAAAPRKVGRLYTFSVFLFFFSRENTLRVFLENSLSIRARESYPAFYCHLTTNNNGEFFFSTDLSTTGQSKGTSRSKVVISSDCLKILLDICLLSLIKTY